jgi:hypothetical protein
MSTRLPSADTSLKSVLVASDFSEASQKPVRHAAGIARHFHAKFYAKEKTIQKFLAADYKKEQVTELLLGIALKTISTCLDHISPTLLDHALAGEGK